MKQKLKIFNLLFKHTPSIHRLFSENSAFPRFRGYFFGLWDRLLYLKNITATMPAALEVNPISIRTVKRFV